MAELLTLEDSEVHIWCTDISQVSSALLPSYLELMSDQEIERNGRYRFEHLRAADKITRALARTVLSRYADIDPADWSFTQGEHGKPEVSNPGIKLRFNLSHTSHMVACVVTRCHDIGLDIENIERDNDVLAIADRYFSKPELNQLFSLPADQQQDRFFDYWTLKEAYMKADGRGISLGLGNFSFEIADTISISFSEKIPQDAAAWRFQLFHPNDTHRMAVAIRTGADNQQELVVRHFEIIPLQLP
ncbi:MAG: 4'-phosphopantetheinyl transferase superfamily protein [Oceanicoccus sp.]|uniref:4'-phosphopantetheinyl transferase family protein n=1 Tax=Oceanicoccus sp. TaxID=2691044 RepID=UPI002624B388|nr:4'-phosphopantetheinyl transferase superfamily protein [Oceanicoccus sp.]MDG1773887.1 4'-phosphopantetheinyl transferase superfamily protein [Oceanicoccus sp.]